MGAVNPLAALAGAGVVLGVLLVVAGARRSESIPRPARIARVGPPAPVRTLFLAAAAAVVVLLVTRWPALALVAGLAVWGVPLLFSGARDAARGIDRVEAIESWVRRLSDVLLVGVGLSQAIVTTARHAPPSVSAEVDRLVARIGARWSREDALRAFAAEVRDPAADLAVAALVLAGRRQGPGLAAALASVADALADEVAVRRRVEADRAKPRATARAVTVVTLVVVALGLATGSYLEPYGTPLGQLVLVAVTALFVVALAWLRAMTLTRRRDPVIVPRVAPGAQA